MSKAEAGNAIYLNIKKEIIRIYAPKPSDSYRKALTRTMTGLPSQLGHQLVNDMCKKSAKLSGCCCAAGVQTLWTDKLPVNVRGHISNDEFTHATYKEVFEAADKVYLSAKQLTVSAVEAPSMDETLPAFQAQNQPQVAAVNRGGGRGGNGQRGNGGGRGGRGGRGRGQGRGGQGGQSQQSRGTKHETVPDNLAEKMCNRHYKHGASAWFCVKPLTCPWVNKVSAQ